MKGLVWLLVWYGRIWAQNLGKFERILGKNDKNLHKFDSVCECALYDVYLDDNAKYF